MRRLYILAVLVLFLGGYAFSAYRMETVLAEGKTILLALPRLTRARRSWATIWPCAMR